MNKYNYEMVIYKLNTTNGVQYGAVYPHLKGCVGGGTTILEAVKEAEENKKVVSSYMNETIDQQLYRKCSGKYYKKIDNGYELTEFTNGKFHCFGNEYEKFGNGIGNYTVGIIELDNGEVITCLPECMKFES